MEYNIYCDESCQLPNDHQPVMVLGAVWCPKDKAREIAENIRGIKVKHNLLPFFEIKWTKVSPGKADFYLELIDYFFQEKDLRFRGLVVPDKSKLKHELYNQDHDLWYYKMFYVMLKEVLNPLGQFSIYLDIKDSKSSEKVRTLKKVLGNLYFSSTVKRVQNVRSDEIEQIQITDLIIGALSYANRGLNTSQAKKRIAEEIHIKRGKALNRNSYRWEKKFNLFIWEASWRNNK